MANDNLRQAKATKNDEFYTQYDDIAAELKHYSEFLHGKIVFCNCDDPAWSNFWKYLHNNFTVLGLKKLISTHYEPDGSPSYKMEYEGGDDLNTEVGTITPLEGNGDFRSEECMEILHSCDVVITNPPFSLIIPYYNTLVDAGKNFIFIGKMNAIHNKVFFPDIKDNKLWLGYNNGTKVYRVPDDYNKPGTFIENGKKYTKMGNTIWFTNIDIKKRHQPFFPVEEAHCYYEGNEEKYPHYFNYDAIDVGSLDAIPIDYAGYMGVPDTIFSRYNPEDFEIIGLGSGRAAASIGVKKNYRGRTDIEMVVDGVHKCPFSRIIIRNRHPVAKKDDI